MTSSALILGEALIDQVRTPDGAVADYAGGSPMNVAIGLARLGRRTTLATWFGRDAHGGLIEAHLAESGVSLVPGSDGAPATSVAQATLDADGVASYVFDLEWRLPELRLEDEPVVAHSGSIATTLAPGGAQVYAALEGLRDVATITYDPNMRPALMGTRDEAWPIVERYLAIADVVKVSDEDLAWLMPGRDPGDVAVEWVERGAALVVVTRGGDGALAHLASGDSLEIATPSVSVVDTVGAGDSFMAGLIDGLWSAGLLGGVRRGALRAAPCPVIMTVLQHAAQIAAITVSRAGANPPWSHELTS